MEETISPKPCRICGFTSGHKVGCPLKPQEENPYPCQYCGYVGEHESVCPLGKKESGGIINLSGIGQETSGNPPVSGGGEAGVPALTPEEAAREFIKKQLPHLSPARVEELVQAEIAKRKKNE